MISALGAISEGVRIHIIQVLGSRYTGASTSIYGPHGRPFRLPQVAMRVCGLRFPFATMMHSA
jgi:hypothetical protein